MTTTTVTERRRKSFALALLFIREKGSCTSHEGIDYYER